MANLAKIIPMSQYRDSSGTSQVDQQSKELEKKSLDVNEKLVKTSEKLATNLEKLALTIRGGAIQSSGAGEVNYKQGGTFDQRSIKDQFKDGLLGRKGSDGKRDRFDQDSLKYKLGSVRGFGKSVFGMKDDSFFGNLAGRREDKLKRADTLMKMNPQMKNLKQFGGDDEKVRQYYIKQHEEKFAPAQAKTQAEKYKMDSLMASGISEEEFGKSVGGKRQKKALETAQAEELSVDKFRKQEVKGVLGGMAASVAGPAASQMPSNVIPFPSPSSGSSGGGFGSDKESTLENNRLMVTQNDMMSGMKENTAAFPIYLEEWREENKEVVKRHEQLIQAIAAGGSGGSGSGIMDMAGDMLGKGKGKGGMMGKAGGMLKGAGGALMRNAGPLAAAAAVIGGGVTAYQGYTGANEKLAKGEITAEQATVEKGGALGEGTGQAVGGAVGALKGAAVGAAIGSVVPVLGTAVGGLIGAAVGGLGGSFLGGKAGSFLGETGGKIVNAFSGPNPDKSGAAAKTETLANAPNTQTAPKEAEVKFSRAKVQQEKIGGQTIAGYESGFNLSGKKEDVDEAMKHWDAFGKAESAGDAAAMDNAAQKFITIAKKIESPEYKAKMREISDRQNKGKKKESEGKEGKGKGTEQAAAATATPKAEAAASATAPASSPKAAAAKPAGGSVTTKTEKLQIAGDDYVLGSPLSDKQMRAVSMKKMMDKDNKYPYPAEVEAQYAKQKPEFEAGNKKMEAEALAKGNKGFDEGAGVKPANKPSGSNAVDSFSKDVASAKEGQGGTQVNSTNTVSQTNVQQRTTTAIKQPVRNNDSSLSKYNDSKYAF
jgi:hypothetical protein